MTNFFSQHMKLESNPTQELAGSITRAASLQTFNTVRYLVDRDLVPDAYRAYAYFRWVDDWLDQETLPERERMDFINRQASLIGRCYAGEQTEDVTAEEQMLVDLVRHDPQMTSGLRSYICHLLAVMAFDAERRHRLISQAELDTYTHSLAVAVTEAMHYFIGHDCASPHGEARYLAVTGAHITHMLRDTLEDNEVGYFNISCEFLKTNSISPLDVESTAYRSWVRSRVELARRYFKAGRGYLAQVENLRCQFAGYAYIARFEAVLNSIERDAFSLRRKYRERKTLRAGAQMGASILWSAVSARLAQTPSGALIAR